MQIIRGTTPTIEVTFSTIDTANITDAILSVGSVEKDLSAATVTANSLVWVLTQTETLSLKPKKAVKVECVWLTSGGVRGQSKTATAVVVDTPVNEVMS